MSVQSFFPAKNFRRSSQFFGASLLALCAVCGCNHTVSDADLNTNVKNAIANDPSIHNQPVQVAVQNGVVTLSGNVSDETASSVAAQDAAKVKGVREVVNSTTVAGINVPPTVTSPAAPAQPRQTTTAERQQIARGAPLPPPPSGSVAPAPPAPTYHDVTAPEGTEITVRVNERLDSQNSQDGQPFSGTVTHAVVHDGYVVIPAGSAASGRVVEAKDAGHFKGHSLLSIELTSVRRHGDTLPISTDSYTLEGKNRGANSAEKIGGGAAVGAVLGGIFGHGAGAAIGAAAGAGGGTALQAATRGQQVSLPAETAVPFRLTRSLTVRTTETDSPDAESGLHRR